MNTKVTFGHLKLFSNSQLLLSSEVCPSETELMNLRNATLKSLTHAAKGALKFGSFSTGVTDFTVLSVNLVCHVSGKSPSSGGLKAFLSRNTSSSLFAILTLWNAPTLKKSSLLSLAFDEHDFVTIGMVVSTRWSAPMRAVAGTSTFMHLLTHVTSTAGNSLSSGRKPHEDKETS
jgi:hypothetical protein